MGANGFPSARPERQKMAEVTWAQGNFRALRRCGCRVLERNSITGVHQGLINCLQNVALAGVTQWTECWSVSQKFLDSIPTRSGHRPVS